MPRLLLWGLLVQLALQVLPVAQQPQLLHERQVLMRSLHRGLREVLGDVVDQPSARELQRVLLPHALHVNE